MHYIFVSGNSITVYEYNTTTQAKNRIVNVGSKLDIEPINGIQYFDVKKPFDIMGFLKTPMGMMLGFTALMLYCMNVMPDAGIC